MSLLRHHQLLMSSSRLAPDHDFGHTAFWPMQETSGSTMTDTAGVNPGTYAGVGTFVLLNQTGPHASQKSVYFNGNATSAYASVPNNANNSLNAGAGEYAVEFWLNLANPPTGAVGMIFGKFLSPSPFQGPTIFSNTQGVNNGGGYLLNAMSYRDSAATGYYANTGSTAGTANDATWRHYIFQRRNTSGSVWKLQLYVNGAFHSEITLPSVLNLSTTNPIRIMGRPDVSQATRGYMSWLHWYKGKSFSAAEAAIVYSARTNW